MNDYQNDFMQARLEKLTDVEKVLSDHHKEDDESSIPADTVSAVRFLIAMYEKYDNWNLAGISSLAAEHDPNSVKNLRKSMSCDYL